MPRKIIALIGLALLAGCSGGGGGDSATPTSAPTPPAQPDILTATSQGLMRGKANGQGQRLVFAHPNLHQPAFSNDLFLANGLVYYPREGPPIILDNPNQDIWSVRADGTDDHAILNTTANEYMLDAAGNVGIYAQSTYTLAQGLERTDYGSLQNGAPLTTLPIVGRFIGYRFLVGTRAYFNDAHQIVSTNVDGSGLVTHATSPATVILEASDAFGNTLLFREYDLNTGHATLKSAPISGGGETPLNDGQAYAVYAGHVGNRVVYQSCGVVDNQDGTFSAGACDVLSVNTDGSGPAVLASHPANEAVQGIIGNQVIIRRNLAGDDPLIAVPVTGGPEQRLMTMTNGEFVQLIVDDLLIVRRPSGTWTLGMNGTLTKIGSVAGDFGVMAVGDSICLNKGTAVWCMPTDGQGQTVKIADIGKVIGAL